MLALNSFDSFFLSFFSGLPGWMLPAFNLITQFGDPVVLVTFACLLLVLGKGNIRAAGAILIIALLLGNMVMSDVKYVVERPRPDTPRITDFSAMFSYSFPSGHVLLAFIAASIIGGFLGWKYRLTGYLIASLVAVSRLYLVLHYATDVIAGAAIGILIGETAVYLAWQFGLCERMGLAGLVQHSGIKRRRNAPDDSGKRATGIADIVCYSLIAAALILSVEDLQSQFIESSLAPLALTAVAAVLIVLKTRIRAWKTYPRLSMALFAVLLGYCLMLLANIYESYRLSLLVFGLMVVALVLLALPMIKSGIAEPAAGNMIKGT